MPPLSYQQPGLVIGRPGTGATDGQVRDLQRHLRALGYLRQGIDGDFGSGSERAVMALRHDLLHNDGGGADGSAPVRVLDYNRGRVAAVSGEVDEGMAGCIADMLDDAAFPKLPFAGDAGAENGKVASAVAVAASAAVPAPFLLAILRRESGGKHFREPHGGDEDSFITVGLDTNSDEAHVITSRGYGVGQYTLFHHPPRPEEVEGFMLDVGRNVAKAIAELRAKFDGFVNGATSPTQADDRLAEFGAGPLRLCKHPRGDAKYMVDCRACAVAAGAADIAPGVTPWHEGSRRVYESTRYYDYVDPDFRGVPVRANFECDWPYAARRYNGSGPNAYNYQALVLKNLLA